MLFRSGRRFLQVTSTIVVGEMAGWTLSKRRRLLALETFGILRRAKDDN